VVAVEGDQVRLVRAELPEEELDKLMQAYREKRGQDREGLERMVFYAQTGQCRWRVLLEHLEESAPFERCLACDNCRRIMAHEKVLDEMTVQEDAQAQTHSANGAPAFSRGDVVTVKRYGRGLVEEASAMQVTVAFADGQRRCFQPEFVAPSRAPRPRAAARPALAA